MTRNLFLAVLVSAWPLCGAACAQFVEEESREAVQTGTPDTSKPPDLARAAEMIVNRTNEFRKKEGLKPVATNAKLHAAAQYFADYMARTNEYGHTADGNRPAERAEKHGYEYCIVLENIANAFDSRGFSTEKLAEQFFTGWKESPGHRKNMLDPDVTETGVAIARSEKTGYYYAVQMFGRPKSASISFKIENRSGKTVSYVIDDRTFELPPRVTRTHTRCRPGDVKFRWPGEQEAKESVTPTDGVRYIVTQSNDQFAVKKE